MDECCGLGRADFRICRLMFDVVFENCDFDVFICKYP